MENKNKLIYSKITAAMKEIDAIGKDKKNIKQGFNFRGIDDVYNALHPILAKHELFTTMDVLSDKTEERKTNNGGNLIYRILTIKYTIYTSDGSCITSIVIGEGMDSGDKASNKAMSIAHKYFFMQLFSIPTKDTIDPDNETPPASEPINLQSEQTKQDWIDQAKIRIDEQQNEEDLQKVETKILEAFKQKNIETKEIEEALKAKRELLKKFAPFVKEDIAQ
jgi:hypothetical protein